MKWHAMQRERACRYTDYLAGVYKSKNKAAFERQKNEDDFKRKFDPFMFKEEVEQRSRTAQTTAVKVRHVLSFTWARPRGFGAAANAHVARESLSIYHRAPCAVQFGKAMAEGKYDWTAEGKQQLLLPSEFKKASSQKTVCPVISWLPEIISVCWKVACELVQKLDGEKGIRQELFDWIEKSSHVKNDDDVDMAAEDKAKDNGDEAMHDDADDDVCPAAVSSPTSMGSAESFRALLAPGRAVSVAAGVRDAMLRWPATQVRAACRLPRMRRATVPTKQAY